MQFEVPTPGTIVWIRRARWRVERARRDAGVVRIDVAGGGRRLTFLAPFDRPRTIGIAAHVRRVRRQHAIAWLAGFIGRHATSSRSLPAAVEARIAILPYQLAPALAILNGAARVLLADEVGLGKTIQAGLAIAELCRRRPAGRILVLVPASLQWQWVNELRAHFGIDAMTAGTGAGWDRAGVWVVSIDYAKQPHVLPLVSERDWDLLVIDEAHGACGDTDRHGAARALASRSRRLVLLSATPHGGSAEHFSRLLAIGGEAAGGEPMTVFRRTRADVGMPGMRRTRWQRVRLTNAETRVLDSLAAFERVVAGRGDQTAGCLLVSVFRKRALSTMSALERSLARRLTYLDARADASGSAWIQCRLFDDEEEDSAGDEERQALSADIGLPSEVEHAWLRRLHGLAAVAGRHESKVAAILRLARRSREPLAIFTEYRDSLRLVRDAIAAIRPVALLHGGLTLDEQRQAIDRFLSGAASVLLATDVASQGLNLQSRCRCVVNLELPWNPSRLEQRAGRVDRLGQTGRVHVIALVAGHTADDSLLERLAERTDVARRDMAGRTTEASPRWSRAARGIARQLCRHRALAARWRGPLHSSRTKASLPTSRATGCRALAIVSVPIVDGAGDLIEQRLACLLLPRSGVPVRVALRLATARASALVAPRLRRLGRWRHVHAQKEAARERERAERVAGHQARRDVQPGLFDRREMLAHAADTVRSADASVLLRRRLDELDAAAAVSAGDPMVVAVVAVADVRARRLMTATGRDQRAARTGRG